MCQTMSHISSLHSGQGTHSSLLDQSSTLALKTCLLSGINSDEDAETLLLAQVGSYLYTSAIYDKTLVF